MIKGFVINFYVISKNFTLTSKTVGKSFMYIANKIGPKILPCCILLATLDLFKQDAPTITHCNRLDKKQENHLDNLLVMP